MADEERAKHLRLASSSTETPDAWLVAALQEQRPGAADMLFDAYAERINRFIWKLLGADADHDDVVQQVFVNILQSIGGLRDANTLGSWIFSVAANTVRRELRGRYYRRLFRLDAEPVERAAPGGPVEDMVTRRFHAVLTTLRPDDRLVFSLHYLAEYSLTEIAGLTGQSLATVKRRLQRAKERFTVRARRDPLLAREELP